MQDPLGFLYAWILKKEGFAVDMNIQKYAAFLKTVEYGSFTKAAESLSYSQSGISRMIADLEKEWEVSLLERGRGGVRLTSDGITLLPYVKRLCTEYDSLQRQVNEMKGLQTGLIRIGTLTSVATHWLPNIIRKFHADYPNIEYELISGEYIEVEEWILEGRVDCGFLRLPAHLRDFPVHWIKRFRPVLAFLSPPQKYSTERLSRCILFGSEFSQYSVSSRSQRRPHDTSHPIQGIAEFPSGLPAIRHLSEYYINPICKVRPGGMYPYL